MLSPRQAIRSAKLRPPRLYIPGVPPPSDPPTNSTVSCPTPHFSTTGLGSRYCLQHRNTSTTNILLYKKAYGTTRSRHKPPGEGDPHRSSLARMPHIRGGRRESPIYLRPQSGRSICLSPRPFPILPSESRASRASLSLRPPATEATAPPPFQFFATLYKNFTLWRQARHPMYQAPCNLPSVFPFKPRLWLLSRPLVLPCSVRARGLGC